MTATMGREAPAEVSPAPLAAALGVSRGTARRALLGKRRWTVTDAAKIAHALSAPWATVVEDPLRSAHYLCGAAADGAAEVVELGDGDRALSEFVPVEAR